MGPLLALFGFGLVCCVFIGAFCGIVAAASLARIRRRLDDLERDIARLKAASWSRPAPPEPRAAPERPAAAPAAGQAPMEWRPSPAPAAAPEPLAAQTQPGPEKPPETEVPPEAAEPRWKAPPPEVPPPGAPPIWPVEWKAAPPPPSFEETLGTKWLVWAGVVLLVIGGGYFLKYAYDNAWIGPVGRLAIGALTSVAALALGERFRRKDWKVLFQSLTGGALAGFYVCVYFSFQVYKFTGQGLAMSLAIVVTALAVTLAVIHDAVAIAILAVIGGFLSPVLLSTGANHPYALFTYIAILDLVAMGAAYFRRWRALDVLTFAATALLYKAWLATYYGAQGQPNQMPPALLFATVFYLLYLAIPMLHSLVRRIPERPEGLALLALNAFYSLYSYYSILYGPHRQALGFVVLGQALLVFLLFKVWLVRQPSDRYTAESLLVIGLALVTLAIPLELKLYAVPIGWAAEACVLVYLGFRFDRITLRLGGAAALVLAAWGLLDRLPLHKDVFTPIANAPFGSWALVAAAAAGIGYLSLRNRRGPDGAYLTGGAFLLGFVLGCALLSFETVQFWSINHRGAAWHDTHAFSSLTALWALIAAATAGFLSRRELQEWSPLGLVCCAIGAIVFLIGLHEYDLPSTWFALNAVFPFRLAFIASLWWIASRFRRQAKQVPGTVVGIGGHALLTLLLTLEMDRWGHHCDWVSNRMALSLVSALWGLQAFSLVALGLHRRNRADRIAGFVLFGLTVGKVFVVDMSALEKVYRIVSFIASGFFLVLAGYFYQRASALLLKEEAERKP